MRSNGTMIETFSESRITPAVPGVVTSALQVVTAATVLRRLVGVGVLADPPEPVVVMFWMLSKARTSCATPLVMVGVMVRRTEWMMKPTPAAAISSQMFCATFVIETLLKDTVYIKPLAAIA